MQAIRSIRGMHDILPAETPLWHWLESQVSRVLAAYDFREIRTPTLEKAELFTRAIGQGTDVVEKEMYAFQDRNGEMLSLRPEGTAGVVRAAIEHGLLQSPGLRVWYQGPMFRHERPQRGRQRQFHQFGAEVFGLADPSVDAELIAIGGRLWRALGIDERIRLEVNTLGDRDDRERYRQVLVDWLSPQRERLDDDSRRRLQTNPLRIFDSKHPETQAIMSEAPRLIDSVGDAARDHFDQVCQLLDALEVDYTVNPALVRGLDYYCRSVFEWVTDDLGAQGTICAGGRYDDLVAIQGGKPTPGIGFAMGAERLLGLLQANGVERCQNPHVFLVSGIQAAQSLAVAERLRDALPWLRLAAAPAGTSFRAQFKRADRSGARLAIVLGEGEFADGQAAIKDLRGDDAQLTVSIDALAGALEQALDDDGRC